MKNYVYKLHECYKLVGKVRNGPLEAEKKIFKNLRRSPYFSHLLTKGMRSKMISFS